MLKTKPRIRQVHRLECDIADIWEKITVTRSTSIKDLWKRVATDADLRWEAIRGALAVEAYCPTGLWCVGLHDKASTVISEASEVLKEGREYWDKVYAEKRVHLPKCLANSCGATKWRDVRRTGRTSYSTLSKT